MPNGAIAAGMITAGIPLDQETGPALNNYTPALLRDRGYIKPGETVSYEQFEHRVLVAVDEGTLGSVCYFFTRTKEGEDFIKRWDEVFDLIKAHRAYEELSESDRKELDPPKPLPVHDAKTIAEILCVHVHNANAVKRLAFVKAPICNALLGAHEGGGKATSTGVMTGTTKGQGKVWSTDLSNEDRRKMGLKHDRIR